MAAILLTQIGQFWQTLNPNARPLGEIFKKIDTALPVPQIQNFSTRGSTAVTAQ